MNQPPVHRVSHRLKYAIQQGRSRGRKLGSGRLFFSTLLKRPLPRLRLMHQLLGFFVLLVLIPLLLLSFSIYGINHRALKKQVAQFTEHTAESIYEELSLEMKWQQEQAQLAGERWETISALKSPDDRLIQARHFFQRYDEYQMVAVYDPTGKLIERFQSPHYVAPDSLTNQLNGLPQKMQFHLDVLPQTTQNHPAGLYELQVAVPAALLGHPARPIGAVVFLKRFPFMEGLITEHVKTFQDGFVVVDADGTIIAGPPKWLHQQVARQDQFILDSLQAGIVKEFSGETTAHSIQKPNPHIEDDPKLERVFIKLPTTGWGLIIESPYYIQRLFILRARAQSVGLACLCILVVVVLGYLYSRGINRNFRQLTKGIKAMADGRYSRKIRLITKSWTPYEVIYLTAEFNRMATQISTAWSSIQKLNQELVYKNEQDVFIAQATQRLHSQLALEPVCQNAVEILTERPHILASLLYLYDQAHNELENEESPFMATAMAFSQDITQLLPDKAVWQASLYQPSVFETALRAQQSTPCVLESLIQLPEGASACAEPIFYQDVPQGILVLVQSPIPEAMTAQFDDNLLINLLVTQIGVAIHQARQWKQLQDANRQLAELDELKSNLIDTVSHELRTPLTNIKGYTSRLIRNDLTLDAETKIKSLKVIKQQADRLGRLVEDLLVIPELEGEEGIRVYPDRVDLNDLMTRCTVFMQEKAHCDIHLDISSNTPEVMADPDRMEQVLLNLLDNAIKYGTAEHAIYVRAYPVSPDAVHIEVQNDCEPISPDVLATLFTKFKRLDERLTRTTRGTGLGLFITRGLVEAMGGKITLDGTDGFRVIITLPLPAVQSANGSANGFHDSDESTYSDSEISV